MMEEEALLINISTILAKDIILDNKVNIKRASRPFSYQFDFEDDEDGLDLLVYEMHQRGDLRFSDDDKILSISDSSEDEQKEPVVVMHTNNNRFSNVKGRRHNIKLRMGDYFTIGDFESNLHLRKSSFFKIFRTLRPLIELRMCDINGVIVSDESFFSLGLWKLATDEHFEEMSRRFKVPLDICHWTVNNFCSLLSTNLKIFVKWPEREHQIDVLDKFSNSRGLKLPALFGIIALQQVDIFLESQDEEASVMLQVICTSDQRLIDCHVSMATSYSFDETPFAKKMLTDEGRHMPKDTYLIGDCSLPLKKYLMRPFRNPVNMKEKKFNDILEEKRFVMNAVLKKMLKRFHSLYALEAKNLNEVNKVLEAICALHNLYETSKDNYVNDSKDFDGKMFSRHFTDEDDHDGKMRRIRLIDSLGL